MGDNIIPSNGMLAFMANDHIKLGICEKQLISGGFAGDDIGHAENRNIYFGIRGCVPSDGSTDSLELG
jgi:hypothetical protein